MLTRRRIGQEHADLAVVRPLSARPAVPEYCRCTPAERVPFFRKPVSSAISTIRLAQLPGHIGSQVIADAIDIPVRPAQQPLHSIRAGLTRPLG